MRWDDDDDDEMADRAKVARQSVETTATRI
jgi:hypothetical protein